VVGEKLEGGENVTKSQKLQKPHNSRLKGETCLRSVCDFVGALTPISML